MRIVFIILFCLLFALSNATTYYISTSGNDATGTGAIGAPWKTLFKATSTVSGTGDIIHVNAGSYTETSQCILHTGVSIEGDGITSIIKSTATATNVAIIVASSAEGVDGNQHISFIKMDGQSRSTSWAIEIRGRKNVSIHDCTIVDFQDNGVYWTTRNDGLELPPTTYATGNTFYNNTVTNCSTFAGFGHGLLVIGGQQGMLIHDNTFTQTGRAAGTNGYCIKYANDGYLLDCKFYNNIVTKEPFSGIPGDFDFALELFHPSGFEIYNNTIVGSIDLNYQPKLTYSYSVYIHDNIIGAATLQAQEERGIVAEFDCESIWVKNNHFRNLYNPIYYSTRNLSQITDNLIYNNLMENCGTTAGSVGFGIRFISDGSANFTLSNFQVYNNTITGNYYQGISIVDAGSISTLSIKNNIIQDFAHSWLFLDPAGVATTVAYFNNDFYNTGTWGTSPRYVGTAPTTVTSGSNLNVNPLFVGSGDYTLQAGSPMIDAGVDVGLPVSGSAPDIGYAETGVIIPPPPSGSTNIFTLRALIRIH